MPSPERQMDSALNPKQSSEPGSLIARLEQANARAYEREQLAHKVLPADRELPASGNVNSDPAPKEQQVLSRTTRLDAGHASPGRAKRRALSLSLFLVLGVSVAAIVWRLSGDDVTKHKVAEWASQVVASLSRLANSPNDQTSAANAFRTPSLAQEAPEKAVPINAAQALEMARVLQTVTREIVALRQGVEQLKASQEQLARDDAIIAEQLKAGSEQTARYTAKLLDLIRMSQEQSTRDNLRIAEQVQASQEQVARVLSKTSKRNQLRRSP